MQRPDRHVVGLVDYDGVAIVDRLCAGCGRLQRQQPSTSSAAEAAPDSKSTLPILPRPSATTQSTHLTVSLPQVDDALSLDIPALLRQMENPYL